jgi:hypothetical protein
MQCGVKIFFPAHCGRKKLRKVKNSITEKLIKAVKDALNMLFYFLKVKKKVHFFHIRGCNWSLSIFMHTLYRNKSAEGTLTVIYWFSWCYNFIFALFLLQLINGSWALWSFQNRLTLCDDPLHHMHFMTCWCFVYSR